MKKIYDLFDFEEVKITPDTTSDDLFYTSQIRDYMIFETFDERTNPPITKEEWIEKSKKTFVNQLLFGDVLKRRSTDYLEYFTDLKNEIEKTGLVDQFVYDQGYKLKDSTLTFRNNNKKNSMKATITFDLNDPEAKKQHKLVSHIDDITHVLWQLDENLRRIYKYDDTKHEEYRTACYDIREQLHQLLNEHGLTIENLQ